MHPPSDHPHSSRPARRGSDAHRNSARDLLRGFVSLSRDAGPDLRPTEGRMWGFPPAAAEHRTWAERRATWRRKEDRHENTDPQGRPATFQRSADRLVARQIDAYGEGPSARVHGSSSHVHLGARGSALPLQPGSRAPRTRHEIGTTERSDSESFCSKRVAGDDSAGLSRRSDPGRAGPHTFMGGRWRGAAVVAHAGDVEGLESHRDSASSSESRPSLSSAQPDSVLQGKPNGMGQSLLERGRGPPTLLTTEEVSSLEGREFADENSSLVDQDHSGDSDTFSSQMDLSRMTTAVPSPASPLDSAYKKIRLIGEGTYGVVYEAMYKKTMERVAIKRIRLDDSPDVFEQTGIPSSAIREVVLLRELKHPNVVALLDVAHREAQLWLVFEYCAKDLKQLLKEERERKKKQLLLALAQEGRTGREAVDTQQLQHLGGLNIEQCRRLAFQLICGVAHCHRRRILHRDLKPQNLLLDENGDQLKIADFGLARTFCIPVEKPCTQEVVTLWYRSPELLLGERHYGTAVDLWSVGCIVAEMMTGRPLFPGDSEVDTLFKIFRLLGTPTSEMSRGVEILPHFNKAFPRWKCNRLKNLTDALGSHELAVDLVNKLLDFDFKSRPSADEALAHPWFDGVGGGVRNQGPDPEDEWPFEVDEECELVGGGRLGVPFEVEPKFFQLRCPSHGPVFSGESCSPQ